MSRTDDTVPSNAVELDADTVYTGEDFDEDDDAIDWQQLRELGDEFEARVAEATGIPAADIEVVGGRRIRGDQARIALQLRWVDDV